MPKSPQRVCRLLRRLTDAVEILGKSSLDFDDLLPHVVRDFDRLLTRLYFCVTDDFANVMMEVVQHFRKLGCLAWRKSLGQFWR